MSRRKTNAVRTPEVARAASGDAAWCEVVFVTECVVDGQRHYPFTRASLSRARAMALTAQGWAIPQEMIARMSTQGRDMWARLGHRAAVAEDTLCATAEQVAALWGESGRVLSPSAVANHYEAMAPNAGALRVLNLTAYDPGCAVYRYHSAANTDARVNSAFVRFGDSNPHCYLRQWDSELHRRSVELLAWSADVIHVHMDYRTLFDDLRWMPTHGQRLAITYHGSVEPAGAKATFRDLDTDARNNSIVFGARPYHHRYGVDFWLPIPMPIDDYRALRAGRARTAGKLRVAHSPTRRAIKGTQAFLDACVYVTEHMGIQVEPVLIEHMEHGEGLQVKASCDAVFDSFWLGMQGSGLEGAAMGLPVLAGDPDAAADLASYNEPCPWTMAQDAHGLRMQLAMLATDATYYAQEAARVNAYIQRWHDYRAVGARYATILHSEVGERRGLADH